MTVALRSPLLAPAVSPSFACSEEGVVSYPGSYKLPTVSQPSIEPSVESWRYIVDLRGRYSLERMCIMSPTQLESQPAWQTCASLPIARDTPTNLFATTATPLLFLSRRRTNRRIGLQNKFIHSKTLAARRGIAQNASSSECSSPQSSFSFRFSPRSPSSSRSPPPSTASPIDPSSSSGSGIRRHPRIQVSSLLTFSQTR